MSSRVALPALKTASSFEKVSLRSGVKGSAAPDPPRHVRVALGADAAAGEGPAGDAHERGLRPAQVEAGLLEDEPHVPPRAQVLHDEALVHGPVVGGQGGRRGVALLQRREDGPRRQDPGLHRVVDALERGHLHEAGGVAHHHQAVAVPPFRHRVEAALGDRLGAPLDQLAALEVRPEERVQLHALEEDVDVEAGVLVVEAHHEARGPAGWAAADRRSSRRTRPLGSGQPMVWMTASSGRLVSHSSFTPRA